ncbi:polyprenol phosphomannose-dependent alpha 1,6 mannosyltransferase MptB [Paractinoplanes lichenicola]|uniref:Polyprenol phosphomannose-dependent alpha 1,6 mannosyltransferase MptB n=1 Tax=Paractinoplanes lichenicola TaxID=2802976 RepID=A0ABS1W1A3_9ACTN|nr:polyprenol phosphomannose-dependent alpha 1,6 mannosyltransferase MptB [Actinoplanes lichenicola]MBL7260487.1 polyprenol phosphomannose-dependent alpha 1,6 mannosyltransferase MptB [Actinoplanes lichenicola]
MFRDHAVLARATGFAGSCLVALGGLGAGALPVGIPFFAGLKHVRIGLVGVYSGLALLLLAWWWYGRATRNSRAEKEWTTLALWAAPLLVAPPMFSRDVYSYIAQGMMLGDGYDVYRVGPSALGGFFAAQVPEIWQHTPSPYGPVFLLLSDMVTAPIGEHLLTGVILMRLLAVAGLALLAYVMPILAREAGINPASALWLAVLNPLVLIHFVGGAHNDALMVGLLAAGLAAAIRHRPVVATVLVVGAALVKAPAVLGLVVVAVIWAAHLPGKLPRLRASAAVGATAAVATAVFTLLAGTGYGWVSALDTPISPQNLSLTNVLGRWTAGILRDDGVGDVFVMNLWRWLGVLAVLVVAALVWTYLGRLGPLYGLGIVLVAIVAFGPALRPWYVIWGLVPLAAAAGQRWVRHLLAGACAVLVLVVLPDGFAADAERFLLATLGALLGIAAFAGVRLATSPAVYRLAASR